MILAILLFAIILRVINLNQSFWLDEAISGLAARDYSFVGIIKDFLPGDTHPPLYYLLLKFWTNIFGFSEISMRNLSVIFGVATVYVVYLLGRKVKDEKFGFLASLFLATAPLHIYYSQEVRMYSLSTLAVSLSIYGYLYVLEKTKTKNWILFSLSLLFVGLVDYLPLLILPVFWLFGFLNKKGKSWWRNFLLSHLPLLAFLVIWFPIFYKQTLGSRAALNLFPAWGELLGKANIKELALVWVKFIIGRISVEPNPSFAVLLALISVPFVFAFVKALRERNKMLLFWLWLALPVAVSFLGSFFVPGFSFFRLLFVLPAFYLLAARGVYQKSTSRVLVMAIFCVNIVFSLVYISNDKFWREDWRSAVGFVESEKEAELVLMAFPEPFAAYRWYSRKSGIAYGVKNFDDRKDEVNLRAKNIIGDKRTIFTLDYLMDVSDPQRFVYNNLKELGYKELNVYNFRGVGQIRYWEK